MTQLEEMLEKILFDKDNLGDLRKALTKTRKGELSFSDLGKCILELRSRIMDRLLEFIPFHLKQAYTNNTLTEFAGKNSDSFQLEHELEERNSFLEKIGLKINSLYEKLKSDLEASH
ncbi:MAG: hypothetical protein ACFE9C_04730 [Candidatus Hodarchaeota archaeon]